MSGMDVDKMDYLLRDAQALRMKLKFEWGRFLEAGEPQLVDFRFSREDDTMVRRIAVREKVTPDPWSS